MFSQFPAHSISILVSNKPGALVFSRRGYNIDSLVVSPAMDNKSGNITSDTHSGSFDLQMPAME